MITAAIIYLNAMKARSLVTTIVLKIKPKNIATPPKGGIEEEWIFLRSTKSKSFLLFATRKIGGIAKTAILNPNIRDSMYKKIIFCI